MASVGAVACLFVGLMLLTRLMRRLGGNAAPKPPASSAPELPRPVGGRRASR